MIKEMCLQMGKSKIFDISKKAMKRAEETFWRGIRIRYFLRAKKDIPRFRILENKEDRLNADAYDIELLLNTVQILHSEIEQLRKIIGERK